MIKVIDVINDALQLLDRTDVAEAYEGGSMTTEQSRVMTCLLHCYNSVEDELARGSFPIIKDEAFTVTDGKLYYTEFARAPSRILEVTQGEKRVKYKLTPEYIATNAAAVDVKYCCCPEKKSLEDDGEYDGVTVSQRLMAYGIAAEYCLIQGSYDESACWESKYKLAIEGEHKLTPYSRYVPPRRWI